MSSILFSSINPLFSSVETFPLYSRI